MEFEFNFGQKTLAQGVKKNDVIYASVAGVALPLSNEEVVFMDRQTGENHVMTHQVLHALSLCQQFKSLDQHVISISENLPELSSQIQAIQQVADFLINKKLLIEDKTWQSALSTESIQQKVDSSGIVVLSNNPKQLTRFLESLEKYQNNHKTSFPIQIYADIISDKIEQELLDICAAFKSKLSITFFGKVWQAQFLQMLKTEFTKKHETLNWLLEAKQDKYSVGRIWNYALLNNAGKKFLFFNDNYIFETRIIGNETNKVNLNDQAELRVDFSLGLTEIRENSQELGEEVLSKMLNQCGQSVGNWVSTSEVKFESVENLSLLQLQRINNRSVIKSVGCGTWGSPRTKNNYWLYNLQGQQKQTFWESREGYLDNIEASNLMHYSDNYQFLSLANFTPSAIDNSSMMPFAAPVNQLEDHFFNVMSLFCYPHQVSLQYPIMMGHIQSKKMDRSSTNHIARQPNFNKFIADYALTLLDNTDAIDPKLRFKTLADYVKGLADSSDTNIHNRLKEYLSQIRSNMVLTMQQQMDSSPEAPVYWQADVREIIEANGNAILQNNAPILADWNKNLSNDECISQVRDDLNQAANAMELWPDVWEFCQTNK